MVEAPTGLAARLRRETAAAHTRAERHAFAATLISGHIPRARYALYLRNLHPVYLALEAAIERASPHPALDPLELPRLARAAALQADLDALAGPGWPRALPLLPAADAYAAALTDAPAHHLVAHAYTRYLGDLSGGRLIGPAVRRALSLDGGPGLAFYTFPSEPGALARRFRDALDRLPLSAPEAAEVITAARAAFAHNAALFEALSPKAQPALGTGKSASSR